MNNSEIEVPSKNFVQKIRPAFVGLPDDSPFDSHLLIWSRNNSLQAGFISDIPDALSHDGSTYHLQQPYVGDWNALISPRRKLAGFSLFISGDEPIITSDFLRRHPQLKFTDGVLNITLWPNDSNEIECVQGIGTRLFVNAGGNYMFLFPQWCDWGDMEFALCADRQPVSV